MSPHAVPAQLTPSHFIIGRFSSSGGSRPPTTNIYNDYIDSLPLHAMIGWRACRGLNVSDDALMTRVFASPWSNMPLAPKGWIGDLMKQNLLIVGLATLIIAILEIQAIGIDLRGFTANELKEDLAVIEAIIFYIIKIIIWSLLIIAVFWAPPLGPKR